jgi:hypothetical protein
MNLNGRIIGTRVARTLQDRFKIIFLPQFAPKHDSAHLLPRLVLGISKGL